MFSSLAYQFAKNNPGWELLIEDIYISVQIDTSQNWKSPPKYGIPKRTDDGGVVGNAGERMAWETIRLRLIADQPIGNDVLGVLPSQMRQANIEFNDAAYTHSAGIDQGLSYGWPGLLWMPTALLLCLIACIKKYRGPHRATITSMAVSILILYLVGITPSSAVSKSSSLFAPYLWALSSQLKNQFRIGIQCNKI